MRKKSQAASEQKKEASQRTPTFLLELPLQVSVGQAARLRAHLEAGRQFYNAVLSEGLKRLRAMRADPVWQVARAIPHSQKQERARAFAALREQYGFSEYALHEAGKRLRVSWLAEHIDAVLAQTLASRAYRSLNRVCLGQARRVRFRSHGRGLSSIENKRNDTGLRFVLQKPEEGNQGCLIWKDDYLLALIDWEDPVVKHGLDQRIKYARLIQRKASSPQAQGADAVGYRYFVQLALEGIAYHKPKHLVGQDTIGADLGPSTIALVPRVGEASLSVFCEELVPDEQGIRRLQRKMDRQRRAANAGNYDSRGRIKKAGGKKPLTWKQSKGYQKIRRCKAEKERKLAAHRKSLHGRNVHEIVAVGNTVILEKISYKGWQKQYGRSVGRASTRDVCSTTQAHRCEYGRHPHRSFSSASQAQSVLPRMRTARQKAAFPAVARVRLWSGSRPAGSVFGVSGFDPGSRSSPSLVCPGGHSLPKMRRRVCGPHTNG